MKNITIKKYLWNTFNTVLLIGFFLLCSSSSSVAAPEKDSSANDRGEMKQESKFIPDSKQNKVESDDPAGPRDRDPSEIQLPSDENSGDTSTKSAY